MGIKVYLRRVGNEDVLSTHWPRKGDTEVTFSRNGTSYEVKSIKEVK